MSKKKKRKKNSKLSKKDLDQPASVSKLGAEKTALAFGGMTVVSSPLSWLENGNDISHPDQPPWIHFT